MARIKFRRLTAQQTALLLNSGELREGCLAAYGHAVPYHLTPDRKVLLVWEDGGTLVDNYDLWIKQFDNSDFSTEGVVQQVRNLLSRFGREAPFASGTPSLRRSSIFRVERDLKKQRLTDELIAEHVLLLTRIVMQRKAATVVVDAEADRPVVIKGGTQEFDLARLVPGFLSARESFAAKLELLPNR